MRTKSEERRQHIVNVAAGVFEEVGFDKASMAEIAQRVGGSKATLYNYFSSKEELFVAVMDRSAHRLMGSVFDHLERPGPLREVLVNIGVQYIEGLLSPDMVAFGRMAIAEGDRSDVGRLVFEKGISKGWGKMRDFLAKLLAAQGRADVDAMTAAWHFKALVESELREKRQLGVYRDMPPATTVRTTVSQGVDLWLRGYGLDADTVLSATGKDQPR
ncbi:TetR/AcrR family transcriptional regulator [Rubrivivax gelatinosus]|uniref:Transcriptional regulator, TetR family n=1 Tax=Rubrivivax gelatinosus (strain NBRC 100245 / IL144) TaxID=983917 RepID=I0HPP8_RUBGI|nr:TetR/AcrR family transcriptional regulator [Rubrivivax gelatinosus]BAL94985.1 transcriptional regulator, TetR family [Rubrivivax gelatinosus IL144]